MSLEVHINANTPFIKPQMNFNRLLPIKGLPCEYINMTVNEFDLQCMGTNHLPIYHRKGKNPMFQFWFDALYIASFSQSACHKRIEILTRTLKNCRQSRSKLRQQNQLLASQLSDRENFIQRLQYQVEKQKPDLISNPIQHPKGEFLRASLRFFRLDFLLLSILSIFLGRVLLCLMLISIVGMMGGDLWLLGLVPSKKHATNHLQPKACSNSMIYLNYIINHRHASYLEHCW